MAFLTRLPSCLQHFSRLFQTIPCPSWNLSQGYRYKGHCICLSFCLEFYLPRCQIIDLSYHDPCHSRSVVREIEAVLVALKPTATFESSVVCLQIPSKQAGSGSNSLRRRILPHLSIKLARGTSLYILGIKSKLKLANYFFLVV